MATREQIAKLYVATFNRAADADGLAYWISDGTPNTTSLTDLTDLAAAMTESPEYQALYSGLDREATVQAMYNNLFNRTAAADELAYWVSGDGGTIPVNQLIIALINGAEADTGSATDAAVMNNKATVGLYFADMGLNDVDAAKTVLAGVTADPATVTAAEATVDQVAAEQNPLLLTTADDSIVGTDATDFFDATTAGTLNNNDVILDSTTTDNDLLKATVTSSGINARLQNVEDVEITGKYVTTGFNLSNTTGTKTLTLDTDLQGGTATVTGANSINAEKIVAGSNINTLNITSLASGTRDTVTVDSGSANVNLTGVAAGADKYDVSIAAGKTLTLATMDSAGDAVTVNAAGDFTLDDSGINTPAAAATNLAVTINNNSADAITVTEGDATLMAKTLTLAGNAITLDVTANTAAVSGLAVTSSAASSTIKIASTATIGAMALNAAVVTTVDVAADISGSTITVNEGTVADLTATQGAAATTTVDIDNANGDFATNGTTGTLLLNIDATQNNLTSAIATGAHVDTVLINAGALADDANGNTQTVTLTELDVTAGAAIATNVTTVVSGANALTINTLTNTAADVVTATGMTGALTIGDFTNDAKVYGGSGNDSFTSITAGAALEIHAGAGDDTVDVSAGSVASTIFTDAGNDSVLTSGNGDTVDLGTGDDKVTANGGASITTGAGADTVTTAATNTATVTDFTTGTDTVTLTGALAGNLDLTNMSQTSSQYDTDGDGANDDLTLTGITASDLSDSIQLNVTGTTQTIVAGAKDDTIVVTGAATITTGAGSDTVGLGSGAGATVKDFTTGTDKIVFAGAAAGSVDLTSVTPTSGAYDLDGNSVTDFTLTDHTETDLTSIVQLGDSSTAFVAGNSNATANEAISVTGGKFDDYIDVADATADDDVTVNFIDNGGFDTISNFTTGADQLSFGSITGITAATAAAPTTHINDAVDGTVYILNNSSVNNDTVDFTVLGTQVNNETVTINTTSVVDDVTAYINNVLGSTTGETYVVALEDTVNTNETYLYLVNGNTDGITTADISLIGQVDSTLAVADIA
ncbi:DUF4214 domain-containing protein [Sulfurimonas sp. NW9]|uniref:DUF4214 domain-containing protein n=1 Tax=Sulfurimonas sp. NW9 TaxID=2922728 RepID=UPI003DA857F8